MKRVGIVTFYYDNKNYGGLLQAYALSRFINSLGCESKQISYNRFANNPKIISQIKSYIKKKQFVKLMIKCLEVLKRKIYGIIKIKTKKRSYLVKQFMDSIPHTEMYTDINIDQCNKLFDYFICGSDQIWNPNWFNGALLLRFVEKHPKIAYAASIGITDADSTFLEDLAKEISSFDYVSLRENNFVDTLSKLSGKSVKHVLDPTLLLTKRDYECIITKPEIKEKYVMVYLLGNRKENKQISRDIAKKMGSEMVYIPYVGEFGLLDGKTGDINLLDVGPSEFLGLIYYSQAVVTDSFHACVFSILFQKEFFCLDRESNRVKSKMSERISSLLQMCTIEDRFIKSSEDYETLKTIDYYNVDRVIESLRADSTAYLYSALSIED